MVVELRLGKGAQLVDEVHGVMIGTRGIVTAVAGAVALAPLLGAGGPDPSAVIAARALVVQRAMLADRALADLEASIAPALDLARVGAARVVAGGEPPGEALASAGELLEEADPVARRAGEAIRALEGARRTLVVPGPALATPAEPGELGSIGAQLAGTAAAADRFASMRLGAERTLAELEATIRALEAGDLRAANDALRAARADHAAIAAWEIDLLTLPIWVEAAAALLEATTALVHATTAGDPEAAEAAAAEVAAQAGGAATADRALRIAMSEGGAAVTAAPLGRLADLLRRLADARREVAAILQSVER